MVKMIPWYTAIGRGIRKTCPRCGQGSLFQSWGELAPKCPSCDLVFEENPGDTWAFMYVSTAFLTGIFIIGMFLVKPANRWLGIITVAAFSLAAMLGTYQRRKGIAVALDFLLR
jgi:uncharacterized protein (DUF983 family)